MVLNLGGAPCKIDCVGKGTRAVAAMVLSWVCDVIPPVTLSALAASAQHARCEQLPLNMGGALLLLLLLRLQMRATQCAQQPHTSTSNCFLRTLQYCHLLAADRGLLLCHSR